MKSTLIGSFIAVIGFALIAALFASKPEVPGAALPAPALDSAFVENMMARCNVDLSPGKQLVLRDQILRVAHQRIEGLAAQQAFVYILCIESKFKQAAKSSVGAVGVAQIMPKYANDFAKMCGLGDIKPDDIQDTEMNLILGSCFFNQLVKDTKNIYLAAAAYNSGASSSSSRNLKNLGAAVPETANYVAKIAVLKGEESHDNTANTTPSR